MLASFASGSPFWYSFKSNKAPRNEASNPKHNTDSQTQPQKSPDNSESTTAPNSTKASISKSLASSKSSHFNPMLMPDSDNDDLFPSSMELLVLDELITQLHSKIADESANNSRSSFALNRPSAGRSRPRPLSGLGIGGLTGTGPNASKAHSRSLSRSSVWSNDSVISAPANDNKCYDLYPYCEVVGEHIIKLAENANHWFWAMNCFNNLSQIYSLVDSLFLDKSPALYIMTIMSLMACHMCKALQMRGDRDVRTQHNAGFSKKHADVTSALFSTTNTTNNNSSTFSSSDAPQQSQSCDKPSVSAIPQIVNKGGDSEFTEPVVSVNSHGEAEEFKLNEPTRKLNKKEIEQLNSDLCDHVLSVFSTLVTSQSHSSTLNLVLGQTIVYLLGHIHLTPKFVKAFFEKLRSAHRLFWYPRSQVLRQWRLYWLQVVMDRMLVYSNYHSAQSGGRITTNHDSKHSANTCVVNTKEQDSATTGVEFNRSIQNIHNIHPESSRNPSVSSLSFTLEGLNLYNETNGENQAGNTNSVLSTCTNDSEATGITESSLDSANSPTLSTTSTMMSSNNGSPTISSNMSDMTDENTIAEEEAYESNPYLLPLNHNDVSSMANIKKILTSCIDELFVGINDETDTGLKQHTEKVFKINRQR